MDQWIARSLENRRTPMTLLAVFGAVALALSAIGIYGVIAFGIAQRAREFGIRHALGADGGSILALVLREGMRTAGAGVAVPANTSMAHTDDARSLLRGKVKPFRPLTKLPAGYGPQYPFDPERGQLLRSGGELV